MRKIHARPHYIYPFILYCNRSPVEYHSCLVSKAQTMFQLPIYTELSRYRQRRQKSQRHDCWRGQGGNFHELLSSVRHASSFLWPVQQQQSVSVPVLDVQPGEGAMAALEVRVVSGRGKYTNEFWRGCNAIKDSVNLQHRCWSAKLNLTLWTLSDVFCACQCSTPITDFRRCSHAKLYALIYKPAQM